MQGVVAGLARRQAQDGPKQGDVALPGRSTQACCFGGTVARVAQGGRPAFRCAGDSAYRAPLVAKYLCTRASEASAALATEARLTWS